MEFFKKRSTAWAVLAITVVACFFIGQAKKPSPQPDIPTTVPGSYIEDNAGVLSRSTKDYITQMNNGLVSRTGNAEIQILTVNTSDGRDLYDVALDVAEKVNLSGYSTVMVFAVDDVNAHIVSGSQITWYFTDDKLSDVLNSNLTVSMFTSRDIDGGIKRAFDGVIDMYEDCFDIKVTPMSGITQNTIADNSNDDYVMRLVMFVMLLVFVIIILSIFARPRRVRRAVRPIGYYPTGGYTSAKNFGGANGQNRTRTGSRSGGFSSGSSRSRGGSFGSGSRSGGFSSGSSFSRGGSFGGSSFGGGSRGGGFSGGSRGGSFGGGSRGGGFKH